MVSQQGVSAVLKPLLEDLAFGEVTTERPSAGSNADQRVDLRLPGTTLVLETWPAGLQIRDPEGKKVFIGWRDVDDTYALRLLVAEAIRHWL
jgi:hypothetical protein